MSSAPERVTACLYCEGTGVSVLDGESCNDCGGDGFVEISTEACTTCGFTSPCRCQLVAYNEWREENGLAIEQGLSGE
jgi:ribosomal protein L37E